MHWPLWRPPLPLLISVVAAASVAGDQMGYLLGWLGHFDIIANNIDFIAVVMVLVSVIPWGIEFLKRRRNPGTPVNEPVDGPGKEPAAVLATEE
jgi:membrane-associated protein